MSPETVPAPGVGVTYFGWSDIEPGTILRVSPNGKRIWFRFDNTKLLNGVDSGEPDALTFSPGGFVGHTSGVQRWEITPAATGSERSETLRQDGSWRIVGTSTKIKIGERRKHYDFNF